jgi:hypothetical protein
MSFVNTSEAIGAVTQFLIEQLQNSTQLAVTAGRPSEAGNASQLNLFLYHAAFDASMKNVALDKNQAPPLWLVLKYIVTGFDGSGESDTIDAHTNLGKGLRALQELSMLSLTGSIYPFVMPALLDNPEELKITFDEVSSELLSKLMQGPDDKYRFSMGFQVRPVMIASGEMPAYNLLVGIDYSGPTEIGEDGINIDVFPLFGPKIDEVQPVRFAHNTEITIPGSDFNVPENKVFLGNKEISIDAAHSTKNKLICTVDTPIGADGLSAGSQTIKVVQTLSSGISRSSNLIIAHLLPAIAGDPEFTAETADPAAFYGTLKIEGTLVGGQYDDIFLALYQDNAGTGRVVRLFNEFEEFKLTPVPTTQDSLSVHIPLIEQPPAGTYRIILRVNGEQAVQSPEISLP